MSVPTFKHLAYKSASMGEHFHVLAALCATSRRQHSPSTGTTVLHRLPTGVNFFGIFAIS